MGVRIRSHKDTAYGLDNALQSLAPQPIVANRAPTGKDSAPLGTIWIYPLTNAFYVLTSVVANVANWEAQASGTFANLTVTNNATVGGTLGVTGLTSVVNMDVGGILSVTGASGLTGNVTITVDLAVNGTTGVTVHGVQVMAGAGSPAGTVTAPQGSLYLNTSGNSTSTRAYINTNSGTTWTAITTAA